MTNPLPPSELENDQWMVASVDAPASIVIRAWLEDLSIGRASFVASQIEEFNRSSHHRVLWTRAAHPEISVMALAAWAVPTGTKESPTAHLLHVGWVKTKTDQVGELNKQTRGAALAVGEFADRVLGSIASELQWVGEESPTPFAAELHKAMNLRRLAVLDYLQVELDRKTDASMDQDSPDLALASHPPNPANHDWWDQALEKSYEHSSDCPDLSQLRKPEEIRLGYQSSPAYEKNRWYKVVMPDSKETIGVAILASAGDEGSELVYMALFPEHRKKGLGVGLMRAIVDEVIEATSSQKTRLILAVDRCNDAARKLYNAFKLKPVWNEAFHLKRFDDFSTRSR
ncbi:MAG: GNAT family N-acetyltransferase [Planctomycetota bacterium]